MRLKFRGEGVPMKFADAEPKFEEVRDEAEAEFQPVLDCAAAEQFSSASDARHGYRTALSQDQIADLSPSEQFAARSAAKWASRDPRGRVADLRRRRSE